MSAGMPGAFVSMSTSRKSLASKLHYMSSNDPTMKATNRIVHNVINGEQSSGSNFQDVFADEREEKMSKKRISKKTFLL